MVMMKVIGGPKEEREQNKKRGQKSRKEIGRGGKQFHHKTREKLANQTWEWLGVVTIGIVTLGMTVLVATGWWQRYSRSIRNDQGKIDWQKIGLSKYTSTVSPTPALPTPALMPEIREVEITNSLELTAESYLVIDVDSMAVLAEKNSAQPWPPASITKVMTAVVALENYPLETEVTIQTIKVEGQKMDLVAGEKITVKNLLYGLLVESGNDAAEALASYFPGGREKFIEAMNYKAKQWHLNDTRFANPSGIDENYHFSTCVDIARMSAMALKNEDFSKMTGTDKIVVESVDKSIIHHLQNTNELLNKVDGVRGIKTGWTEESGESLVTLTERGGHRVVTVMLGSENRFEETEKLINWIFENTQWRKVGE